MYVTVVVVPPESDPQFVEGGHVRLQVTPLLVESF
jgi:hypothetical protein